VDYAARESEPILARKERIGESITVLHIKKQLSGRKDA
jgi:hypothetical protein